MSAQLQLWTRIKHTLVLWLEPPIPQLTPPWQKVADACPRHPETSMQRVYVPGGPLVWRCPVCESGAIKPVSPIRQRAQARMTPALRPVAVPSFLTPEQIIADRHIEIVSADWLNSKPDDRAELFADVPVVDALSPDEDNDNDKTEARPEPGLYQIQQMARQQQKGA